MLKLQNTGAITSNQGIKVLVYGGAGTGKTRLCSTAPRPIILSAESGLLSLRKFNLPFFQIENFKDLVEVYNWAIKGSEIKNYDTLCLDSISEIAEVVLADLKAKTKDPRKAYGEVQDQMIQLIRDFRDIKEKHVYFSAKQDMMKDSLTGSILYGPMMPGQKLPVHLPYFFDEVFQIFVYLDPATQQKYHTLRCQKDNQNEAKDRSGTLEMFEAPNLNEIFSKIMKG